MTLPPHGMSKDDVIAALRAKKQGDVDWRGGRTFSLVYHAGDDVNAVLHAAANEYFSENALSPMAFPGLRQCETEVLRIAASLFHLPEAVGAMTSGGNESILMAVKVARDHARVNRPHITRPELLLPITAHPAFVKAAKYFDVVPVFIPVGDDYRADLDAARALVTDNTVLVVGSAPQYPHGVVDPIAELAELASQRGILFHVDACLGGFLLPFLERLGYPVPPFDFRIPGVTSISADLHKYGWAAKGASVVLYRTPELRRFQFIAYGDWPGGLYGSPSMAGTRPAGPIAAAWAVLQHLGEDGYLRLAKVTMETARAIIAGVRTIEGLTVMGDPVASVFGVRSDTMDIFAVSELMESRGWHMDRLQRPSGIHFMITPAHAPLVDRIVGDLRECADEVRRTGRTAEGAAAMYGALAVMEDRTNVNDFILGFLDNVDG